MPFYKRVNISLWVYQSPEKHCHKTEEMDLLSWEVTNNKHGELFSVFVCFIVLLVKVYE